MQRWVLAAIVSFGALVAVDTGCHEPTEIIVRVTTSFDCNLLAKSGVGVRVGTTAPLTGATSAISNACANGYVGSLVLTPSSAYKGQSFTVEAVAALAPSTLDADGLCVEGTPNCIHARRALPYLDGSSITVPITLDASCAGLQCDPSETCVNAQCVPASVDPKQCKTDCSLDGGTVPQPDAGTAPPECGDMTRLLKNAAMPMDRYCPGHVGYGPYAGPAAAPSQLWAVPTGLTDGQIVQPPPVVIDENDDVYFMTPDAKLHAFSARTGVEKWQPWPTQASAVAQGPGSLLLSAEGTLYVSNDTLVIAVDRNTGNKISSVAAPDNVRSTLTPGPLGLYFAGPNDKVETVTMTNPLALGPTTVQTASQIDGSGPTMLGGNLWVADGLGNAYAFNATNLAQTGSPLKVAQTAPVFPLTELAVAPGGSLRGCYVDAKGGIALAFDATTVLWAEAGEAAATCDTVGVLPDGSMLYDDDNRNLFRFDKTGNHTAYVGNGHPHFPGIDVNGIVYTLDDPAGHVIAYPSPPAAPLWTSTVTTSAWGIYVGTDHDLVVMTTTQVLVLK